MKCANSLGLHRIPAIQQQKLKEWQMVQPTAKSTVRRAIQKVPHLKLKKLQKETSLNKFLKERRLNWLGTMLKIKIPVNQKKR